MSITSTKYTTHQGIAPPPIPIDTVLLIKPLTSDDKAKAAAGPIKRRGVEIEPERIGARIELADWSLHLAGRG